ncbi:MAG TPA: hypothetical protein VMN76_00780 [Acidobacteriota bacterium]|nr:hypothetical protein [Acidobacteriota bacterium]
MAALKMLPSFRKTPVGELKSQCRFLERSFNAFNPATMAAAREPRGTRTQLQEADTRIVAPNESGRALVALLVWDETDGIAEVIGDELDRLNYTPLLLRPYESIPPDVPFVFTFGPYGKLLEFLSQLDHLAPNDRPVSVHWNTEGIPDPRLPWFFVRTIGSQRSRADLLLFRLRSDRLRTLVHRFALAILRARMLRFRYVGDLYFAYRKGWIHVMGDTSQIYSQLRSRHGLPTLFIPWGVTAKWYANLELERDIDVLWMGKKATRRRSAILHRLRDQLRNRGLKVYMADNEERPFIFGETRIEFLNRAKITLNLTRTWYDDNFSRFILAAPNRSLIVSERLLPHCPYFEAGTHYMAGPADSLSDLILRCLEDEEGRSQIVDNCYKLVMTKLTLRNSIQKIMQAAEEKRTSGTA